MIADSANSAGAFWSKKLATPDFVGGMAMYEGKERVGDHADVLRGGVGVGGTGYTEV
jgi:hypothetical protein